MRNKEVSGEFSQTMQLYTDLPAPVLFNPFKHHLGYIRYVAGLQQESVAMGKKEFCRFLQHIGGSVTDVYTGSFGWIEICRLVISILGSENHLSSEDFLRWTGEKPDDFKTISLPDNSSWVVKYHRHKERWVHLFPARQSLHTLRVKANTLKSAILYHAFVGKDFITSDSLNEARAICGLSPVKSVSETEAIYTMIEILRT
ncbi:MAG TPA: hypothetical protein P5257_02735 [Bacteroidales bacterium]|nr:hypothetical protein [Bacteroidales bacterium]HRT89012.1 hypothetical protein [Bacteroidales bacterium]